MLRAATVLAVAAFGPFPSLLMAILHVAPHVVSNDAGPSVVDRLLATLAVWIVILVAGSWALPFMAAVAVGEWVCGVALG